MKVPLLFLATVGSFASALPQAPSSKQPQGHAAASESIEMVKIGAAPPGTCSNKNPGKTPGVFSKFGEKIRTKIGLPKLDVPEAVEEVFQLTAKAAGTASFYAKQRPDLVQEYFKTHDPSVMKAIEKYFDTLYKEFGPSGRKLFKYTREDESNACDYNPDFDGPIPGYTIRDKKTLVICPLLFDPLVLLCTRKWLGTDYSFELPLQSTRCGGESKITALMNLVTSYEHGLGHQKYTKLMKLTTKQALQNPSSYVMLAQALNWELEHGIGSCSGAAKQVPKSKEEFLKQKPTPSSSSLQLPKKPETAKLSAPRKEKTTIIDIPDTQIARPQNSGWNNGKGKGKQTDV